MSRGVAIAGIVVVSIGLLVFLTTGVPMGLLSVFLWYLIGLGIMLAVWFTLHYHVTKAAVRDGMIDAQKQLRSARAAEQRQAKPRAAAPQSYAPRPNRPAP